MGTPLPPEFIEDAPYGPGGLLIDELIEVDIELSLVRVRMPTHDGLPITEAQRAHPVRHPRHVSGGLMVHMTGVVGFVHAYYVLGLRHHEGWIGYGVRIHDARFSALARPPEPLILEGRATRVRKLREQLFVRYTFRFEQAGVEVYTGEQSAAWTRVVDEPICPE